MSPPEGSKNGSQTSVLNVDSCLITVWSLQQRANRRAWASSRCRPNPRLSLSEEHVTPRRSTAVKTHSQSLWKHPRVFLKDSPVPDAITHKHRPLQKRCSLERGGIARGAQVRLVFLRTWAENDSAVGRSWRSFSQTHSEAKLASWGESWIADGWDEWHEAVYAKLRVYPFDTRTFSPAL